MVNVGIIGAGNISKKMAITINADANAVAYAVGARDLAKAQAFADEFGFEKAYGSYLELVQDPDVELVYVATPHNFHYEHAKLALNHGKHVLCEKATTINEKQLQELIEIAKVNHLTFVEAIWSRFMPLQMQLKEMLDNGIIGKPLVIQGSLCYQLEHLDRMWNPNLAGGALLDLGVYPIHFALSMFGNDYQTVQSKMVLTDLGVDRHTSVTLTYADGRMAQLFTSMAVGRFTDVTILGETGLIRVTGSNHIDELRIFDTDNNLLQHLKRPEDVGGFDFELAETIKMIKAGKIESPIVTHEDSLAVMHLLDTIRAQNNFKYPEEDN